MRFRNGLVALIVARLAAACTDGPAGPRPPGDGDPGALPGLIVSEPVAPARALVSLPTGKLSDVASVRIRNLTTGAAAMPAIPVVDGGFDPARVPATAGDRLGLELIAGDGTVAADAEALVPVKRPPVVVRVTPSEGRTDVALSVRPVVVFSEPMDPASLTVGMRLFTGGTLVSARIEPLELWAVELVPAAPLTPGTEYRVEITRDAKDQTGTALQEPVVATFTTEADPEPFTPALAFVRMTQPTSQGAGSPPAIYLATADGSRVRRLTDGEGPAWSPDGRRIAFVRGAQLRIIEADGFGERLLASGDLEGWVPGGPSWSPDGTKLIVGVGYSDGLSGNVLVVDVLLPGAPVRLIGTGNPNSGYAPIPGWPQWSPDGRSISFVSVPIGWDDPRRLAIMDADGSDQHLLAPSFPPCQGIDSCEYMAGPIHEDHAWSPDGSRIAAPYSLYYPPTLTSEGRTATALVSFDRSGDDVRVHFAEPRQDGYSYLEHPSWSPDGRGLAFAKFVLDDSCTPPECPMRIWTLDLESGAAGQLIRSAGGPAYWDRQPAWSPAAE
ncbi:MAG TPA: Ig-like domain-containing protein [Gemmatimonadales bacterium]